MNEIQQSTKGIPLVAALARWLPRMLKVARSIPGSDRDCTDLYYARRAQGVLPNGVGDATSQLDLPSLTPLSVVSEVYSN